MKKLLALFVCLFIITPLVFAETTNISNLVFITAEQTIKPGQISKEITVQTQNSSASAEKVSETNDVEFKSTSNTGEFLNSAGNPVTTTMSRETSSRTFYYRDSASGTHTLTVKVIGRDSGKTFLASQQVIVGESEITQNTAVQTNTSSDSSSNTSQSVTSSHSNQASISTLNQKQEFKTDIGRARIVAVNTPIVFEVSISDVGGSSKKGANPNFYWSFGDGTSGRGRVISHTYSYPGDYIVMLNAKNGDLKSVSKTEVKVIEPDIKITSIKPGPNGFVEIGNDSPYELNIGSWSVANLKEGFVVAPDTILKPKSSLKLPFSLSENSMITDLKYPTGHVAFTLDSSAKENTHIANIAEVQAIVPKDLVALKKEPKSTQPESLPTSVVPAPPVVAVTPANENINEGSTIDQSAALLNAFNQNSNSPPPSFKTKFFNFFKNLFGN